ncbi:MAG: hypothetical protein ISR98_00365 [Parcubacteria group bacterium]|nr:hypothetical protein [Parcubacteria group bacterium]
MKKNDKVLIRATIINDITFLIEGAKGKMSNVITIKKEDQENNIVLLKQDGKKTIDLNVYNVADDSNL